MLNNDLLQVTNSQNQTTKPADNDSKENDEGCCNKEKFEDSLNKAFSTNSGE